MKAQEIYSLNLLSLDAVKGAMKPNFIINLFST